MFQTLEVSISLALASWQELDLARSLDERFKAAVRKLASELLLAGV